MVVSVVSERELAWPVAKSSLSPFSPPASLLYWKRRPGCGAPQHLDFSLFFFVLYFFKNYFIKDNNLTIVE